MNSKGLLKAQSAPKVLRFYESLTYGDLFKGNGFSNGRADLEALWYFENDEKQSHKRQDNLVYFIRNN